MTTAIYPARTYDSHDGPAPCACCGGKMKPDAAPDLLICVECGCRRSRPMAKPAAATRDDAIRSFVAEHLHLLQERADMSDAWCAAEMAALEKVLA